MTDRATIHKAYIYYADCPHCGSTVEAGMCTLKEFREEYEKKPCNKCGKVILLGKCQR